MSSGPGHGVCIVRAVADGAGVHFSVVTTQDAEQEEPEPPAECRSAEDAATVVRAFLDEFTSRHLG